MNKAFIREPDSQQSCLSALQFAGCVSATLGRPEHCDEATRRQISELAFFCPSHACPVVYFDSFERTVDTSGLLRSVYLKDPNAPVCACFGLTCADIEAGVDEGVPRRVRELLTRARSDEAHCQTAAASGQPCITEVQKYYLKLAGQRSG